jgi:hypothetical protein
VEQPGPTGSGHGQGLDAEDAEHAGPLRDGDAHRHLVALNRHRGLRIAGGGEKPNGGGAGRGGLQQRLAAGAKPLDVNCLGAGARRLLGLIVGGAAR